MNGGLPHFLRTCWSRLCSIFFGLVVEALLTIDVYAQVSGSIRRFPFSRMGFYDFRCRCHPTFQLPAVVGLDDDYNVICIGDGHAVLNFLVP